ncbi:MAG TPA: ABC transporter ATP-binding protein [Candidatus Pullichristensenella excrementigallinarum]|uniref:ABC transporter ATP-binding protein n=1 Tax=Candidatus Pullichristensenella excrementigallinarum TaxID=2840907 RepID=A0A9D1IBJ3_9FIRM|nr:ABC transporter ATP-binding protein [Candidatus Pullichristensenella excrementigallinarum]
MLEISNFSKTYKGGKRAVDCLTLSVRPGEIVGFIGHNGAGKTTTIRAIAGVLGFEEGEILIDGKSIRRDPIGCKKVLAYVPDNPDLYEYLTGMQYLNFLCDVFGVSAKLREKRIREYAQMFEFEKNLGDVIGSYSHGMKQRLALIGAMVHDPKLLILDEPFVGLDPVAAHSFKNLMRGVCDQGGAVFFSTHVLDVAEKLCDKIAIIRRGKLVAFGETDRVRGDSSLEEVFLDLVESGAAEQ